VQIKPLQAKWFPSDLTAEKKKDFESAIRNCRHILDRLTEILEEELKSLEADQKADYQSPSWAYLQADNNGARRTLRNLLKLTKLT